MNCPHCGGTIPSETGLFENWFRGMATDIEQCPLTAPDALATIKHLQQCITNLVKEGKYARR